MTTTPKLYCGTYHKYACGSLRGRWFDLTDFTDAEQFLEECKDFHSDEKCPELMFQDFKGIPSELYKESMNDEDIQLILDYIELCECQDEDAVQAFCEEFDKSDYKDDIITAFEDAYVGEFEDAEDFGRHFAEEEVEDKLPAGLADFFDYERFGESLLVSDYCERNGFYFHR